MYATELSELYAGEDGADLFAGFASPHDRHL